MALSRDAVIEALDRGMLRNGWSKRRLAEESDYPYTGLIDFYRGKVHLPRGDGLFNLLSAVDALHLLTGEAPRARNAAALAEHGDDRPYRPAEPAASVRIYDQRKARKMGRWDAPEAVIGTQAYPLSWLAGLGVADPGRLAVICHTGNSNAPYYLDEDKLLVDRGRTRLAEGEFFAFAHAGDISVRTPQLVPGAGTVRLLARNDTYAPVELDADTLEVVGMVIEMQRSAHPPRL